MSLIQEARERIRIQKAVEPATEGILRARHEQRLKDLRASVSIQGEQAGRAWRVEEGKRRDLQLEIRSKCTALLAQHGFNHPSFENVSKVDWNHKGRFLSSKIGEGEESISIDILSQSFLPEKGDMIILIEGLGTSLVLSPTRPAILCKNDGMFSWESATSMTLGEYKGVVELVKEKFQPSTPAQAPR